MKIKNIPKWCNKKYHPFINQDNKSCCRCGFNYVVYQIGDGKVIHSLCDKCRRELTNQK